MLVLDIKVSLSNTEKKRLWKMDLRLYRYWSVSNSHVNEHNVIGYSCLFSSFFIRLTYKLYQPLIETERAFYRPLIQRNYPKILFLLKYACFIRMKMYWPCNMSHICEHDIVSKINHKNLWALTLKLLIG